MPQRPTKSYQFVGSTPPFEKPSGSAVALCPTAPLVAESGKIEDKYYLRIANYRTGHICGTVETGGLFECQSLIFSPSGKRIFATHGFTNNPVLFEEPWDAPAICVKGVDRLFDRAWLDDDTVLLVGRTDRLVPYVRLLNVPSQEVRPLDIESQIPNLLPKQDLTARHLAACSSSGLVVFNLSSAHQIAPFQIRQDRQSLSLEPRLCIGGRDDMRMTVAEDGRTILCVDKHKDGVRLFDRVGRLLDSKPPVDCSSAPLFRQGALCSLALRRGRVEKVEVFKIMDAKFIHWASVPTTYQRGIDLLAVGDCNRLAIEERDRTSVYELTDFDLVQLRSEDQEQRLAAMHRVGNRRLRTAVPELGWLLWAPEPIVQRKSASALAEIGDVVVLPQMIRRLGRHEPWHFQRPDGEFIEGLLSALRVFGSANLTSAALDCLNRPAVTHRRGAARLLHWFHELDAGEALCQALADSDVGVRLAATFALNRRADLRSSAALLGHLNDPDLSVQKEVRAALQNVLRLNGLPAVANALQVSEPFDVVGFARATVATGRVRDFDHDATPATEFLCGLAGASIEERPLPDLLNAVEALTASVDDQADESPLVVGLVVALVCADVLRRRERWPEAARVYRHAVTLARRATAPQIEWHVWDAIAECRERAGDDPGALAACREAMEVIDRLWFLLLDEDKLCGFFADKAQVYDRAALCALRLGQAAAAFEYVEKSKTRYLGDLIARRHSDPRRVVAKEVQEFWGHLRQARPARVAVDRGGRGPGEVEITGVAVGASADGGAAVRPARLAAFEEACRSDKRLQERGRIVRDVWQLIPTLVALDEEGPREALEGLYQPLRRVRDAARTGSLPLPPGDLDECLRQYTEAAERILASDQGRPAEEPFWAFSEYETSWFKAISESSAISKEDMLMLEAVVEALNVVLRHETVIASSVEGDDEEPGGLVFFASSRRTRPTGTSTDATTVVETTLAQFARTRWRHVARLARGDSCSFRDVVEPLRGRSDVAHVQFLVSEHGTVAFVAFGSDEPAATKGPLAPLGARLEVLSFPELRLRTLRKLLSDGDESWLGRYSSRRKPGGHAVWFATLDRALAELSHVLLPRLRACLAGRSIRRLVIVPHRDLHLVPFGALFTDDGRDRRYLADDYEVSYAPSSTLRHIARERSVGRVGEPSLTAVSDPRGDLHHAAMEVEAIRQLFLTKSIDSPCVLAGGAARLDAVRALRPGTFFHFAGHGLYRWDTPLTSALLLADTEELALGSLFDEELALPATQMVVLSACETGLVYAQDAADEWLGLAAGFLFAGVPCVVSTLWAVDDRATMLLVSEFYDRLFRSWSQVELVTAERAARALGEAQAWLRELPAGKVIEEVAARCRSVGAQALDERARDLDAGPENSPLARGEFPFSHPYYWAGFTISGA